MRGSNKLKNQSVTSPKFSSNLEADYTSSLMVSLPGQPRTWAGQNALPFAGNIHPKSPMWMGFADQHISAAAAAPNVTFAGMAGRDADRQTTASPGSYFDTGSVQHFSHVLLDLEEFYDEEYEERAGYMFRFTKHLADPYPNPNVTSPPTTDGGPAYIDNTFEGTGDADANAQIGDMGHVAALQRSSRSTIDGSPLHIRLDGPGFDRLDMKAAGIPSAYQDRNTPKLQFSIFVPSAEFFRTMRRNASAQDLVQGRVDEGDNGLEFFTTTTRRQNFLVPPRRNRSFPLVDLTSKVTDGYDTKLQKRLSEDKKVYVLQIVDDDVWAVEAGYSTTLQFEAGVPAGATIRRVLLYVRHYEEKDISTSAQVWQVGTGSLTRPTILGSTSPAQYVDQPQEARAEWDVSAFITTPAQANDLKLVLRNTCRNGKKSYVNNAYLWVDYS